MLKDVRKVSIDLALSQLSDFPPGTALLMRCNVTVRTLLTKEFLIHGPHGDRTMATHEGTREQLQMAIKIQITGELIIIRTAHRTTSMLVESMVLAQLAREPSYCWILRSLDCPDSMNFFGLQSTEKKKRVFLSDIPERSRTGSHPKKANLATWIILHGWKQQTKTGSNWESFGFDISPHCPCLWFH